VQINPLVGWIWYGGIIITIGSLISLWPAGEVRRRAEASSATEIPEAVAAGAGTA